MAEALALKLKGGRKQGYGCVSKFGGGWGVGKDSGDEDWAADGAHKQQLLEPVFMPTQLHLLPCCDGVWNGVGW